MKHCMVEILAKMAYWAGVDAVFYWVNRRAKRIVTFHNVLPDEMFRTGLANGVSNRLSDFLAIIDECRKRYRVSTDLLDPKTLTFTFDDGYRNQYTVAFRELRKMGIPAYVFVSGDVLEGRGLLIDRLLHWVAEAPIECIPGGDRFRYWVDEVWPKFMADAQGKGANVLAALNERCPYSKVEASLPTDYLNERMGAIAAEELQEMRTAGWKIGWHTRSHYPLSKLKAEDLMAELDSPPEYRAVCFSYPYGNPIEVGEAAIQAVEKLGYPCAVSNTYEALGNGGKFFLPRMTLSANKYLLHFELSGLKYFIRRRKLLPRVKN